MKKKLIEADGGRLLLNPEFSALLEYNNITSAAALWELESSPVKNVLKERGTGRLALESSSGEKVEAFIKRYQPIPLRERIKNTLAFKPWNFDAVHEIMAVNAVLELGLHTMTPIAAARLDDGRSCNLTLGIDNYVRAQEFIGQIRGDQERMSRLTHNIATLVGRMHGAGMAHQDMYLVHMFVRPQENDAVYIIDLQRTIFQRQLSQRWRVKDLAQLLFSSREYADEETIDRFWESYSKCARLSASPVSLKAAVKRKADAITRHDSRRRARLNLGKD